MIHYSWLWIQMIFNQKRFLILPHPLTDFATRKYYQNESRFNGVYSRDNLPNKIKDGAYVINLDEYADFGTHWIAIYEVHNNVTYFENFGVEHNSKEIKKFIDKSTVVTDIFRIHVYDSIMCEYILYWIYSFYT